MNTDLLYDQKLYELKATPALEKLGLTIAQGHLDTVCQQAAA